jgi:uncharacterized repeat protein (TIGR02543 family)
MNRLVFNANGGTPDETIVHVEDNTAIGEQLPSAPTRQRYSFDGWFTDPTGGTQITSSTISTTSTTYYAHWTQTEALVTFEAQGGTASADSLIVNCGTSIGSSNLPTATKPNKTNYKSGEKIDWTGLQVNIWTQDKDGKDSIWTNPPKYIDGRAPMSELSFSVEKAPNISGAFNVEITWTYKDKSYTTSLSLQAQKANKYQFNPSISTITDTYLHPTNRTFTDTYTTSISVRACHMLASNGDFRTVFVALNTFTVTRRTTDGTYQVITATKLSGSSNIYYASHGYITINNSSFQGNVPINRVATIDIEDVARDIGQ